MRIWIDLANSPHVPFFRALTDRFTPDGHPVAFPARHFAKTVPLATAANLSPQVVGVQCGKPVTAKASNLISRAWSLASWARARKFDLAISHNSYSQILAALALRVKSVTLMDYEYQPANHLAFRFTSRIIVPTCFPDRRLRRYGANPRKVRRYHGTKEDVYLSTFQPDPSFQAQLSQFGIHPDNVMVLMRPPAHEALYHRFQTSLFDQALDFLLARENVKVMLLPRSDVQRSHYSSMTSANLIVPAHPLAGPDLIASSDLVISAGGTINREAAALGVPVASVYAGKWAAVDEELVKEGRLKRITTAEDVRKLSIRKKQSLKPRRAVAVIEEVVKRMFE